MTPNIEYYKWLTNQCRAMADEVKTLKAQIEHISTMKLGSRNIERDENQDAIERDMEMKA